jgi:hypothetical protein
LILVGVNALAGGMVGQKRTVLPLLAPASGMLKAYRASEIAWDEDERRCKGVEGARDHLDLSQRRLLRSTPA